VGKLRDLDEAFEKGGSGRAKIVNAKKDSRKKGDQQPKKNLWDPGEHRGHYCARLLRRIADGEDVFI